MIPRVIHRVWLGGPMPDDYREHGERWVSLNPGWRVREWGDDDMAALGADIHPLWATTPGASGVDRWRMRSDIARLLILARHGGVYVDSDFEPCEPFGDLLDGHEVVGCEERPGLVANGFLACTPGHRLITALLDGLVGSVAARPGLPPWRTTGPEHLTRTIAATGVDVHLIPTSLLYPYHHTTSGARVIPPGTIAHHRWASASRRVSVLIPWRDNGCEHRRAAYGHVVGRYRSEHPDWQIVPCADDGRGGWAKGQAILDGAERAAGDVLVVADADLIAPHLDKTVDLVRAGRVSVAMPYTNLHRLDAASTARVLAGAAPDPDMATAEPVYEGVIGGGIVVVDRRAFEIAPPDPRFRGWGGEDEAWGMTLTTLAGALVRPSGTDPVYHLWHPPQERISRDIGNAANHALWGRYRAASGNRRAMQRLIAEWRDGAEREPLTVSESGWWRHVLTGACRFVDPASDAAQRIAGRCEWQPTDPPR